MMPINLSESRDIMNETAPEQPVQEVESSKPENCELDLLSFDEAAVIPKSMSGLEVPLSLLEQEAPIHSIEEALACPRKIEIKVVVLSPSLMEESWLSSYWEYPISTTASGYKTCVKRRFSDLEWLHSRLQSSYPGIMLPQMPQKSFFKKFDSEFLLSRRQAIEKYLNFVVNHTKIRRAPEVPVFLLTVDTLNLKNRPLSPSIGTALQGMYANFMVSLVHPAKYNEGIQQILSKVLAFALPTKVLFAAYSQYANSNQASNSWLSTMTGVKAVEDCFENEEINRLRGEMKHSWELELNRIKSFELCVESYMRVLNDYQCNYFLMQEHLKKQRKAKSLDDMFLFTQQLQTAQELTETLSNQLLEVEENIRAEVEVFEEERRKSILKNLKNVVQYELQSAISNKEDSYSLRPY